MKLTIERPNTIGVTFTREYECYSDAEEFIERKCEQLADNGWELTELKGSNPKQGCIEAIHDNEADILLIQWE